MKKIVLGLLLSCCVTASSYAANKSVTNNANAINPTASTIKMTSLTPTSAAVLLQLKNKRDERVKLIAAYSPVAQQAQLQVTSIHNANKTHQVHEMIISPKQILDAQNNHLQVALLGLKQTLHAGDTVPVILIFADGSNLQVQAKMS